MWHFLLCSLHYGGDSETCLWSLSFRQQIYSQTLLQVLFLMLLFDLGLCRCVQGVVPLFSATATACLQTLSDLKLGHLHDT